MPNPKCHTAFSLFQGTGAPPSPFTTGFAGGASAPTQELGSLRFQGVGVGGSSSQLEYSDPLDLTNDALFLQFESLIGQPGTVELDLTFSSGWILTLQLRGLNWNVFLLHGATTVLSPTASVDEVMLPPVPPSQQAFLVPNLEPLCWEIAYQVTDLVADTGTLELMWGPTPETMRAPYVITQLPASVAENLNDILLTSTNLETQSITYGETRLIGWNAWYPPGRTAATQPAPAGSGSLTPGAAFTGLTGHGSLALDTGTVAVRVQVTTDPGWFGFEVGDPDVYFGQGWINFRNIDSAAATQWLEFHDQVFSNQVPGMDTLGWSFRSGLECTITCLLPA